VSSSISRADRANASPRARGRAGGALEQGQTYSVERGDTLSGIAARIAGRPSIRAAADAIFAANPNAFTRGNRDLLEAGRSITIPALTGTTPARVTMPAPLPAVRDPSAPPTPVTRSSPAPARVKSAPPLAANAPPSVAPPAEILPVPAPAPTPAPTPAPVREEPTLAPVATLSGSAPADASAAQEGGTSVWLIALLALGVVLVAAAPLAFIRRRRERQAAALGRDRAQKMPARRSIELASAIEVVEERAAHAPAERSALRMPQFADVADVGDVLPAGEVDLALSGGATEFVDLDVGAPDLAGDSLDWFTDRSGATGRNRSMTEDETIEDVAATVRIADVDTVTVRRPAIEPDSKPSKLSMDDEMALTVAEIDLLRQDYEAQLTMTQHSDDALDDAVAELERATKLARDPSAETSTLQLPEVDDTSGSGGSGARVRRN
jgi:hypothetical protein